MKKLVITLAVVAIAALVALPRSAYAWPEQIEEFGNAVNKGDVQAALSLFTDDAAVVIPSALASSKLKLEARPAGATDDGHSLRLAGKKLISAWLDEFLVQQHGGLTLNGPATMKGNIVDTPSASYWDDNTQRIMQNAAPASIELELQGSKIKGLWLKLPGDLLTKLEAANTQITSKEPQGGETLSAVSVAPPDTPGSTTDLFAPYAWVVVPGGLALLLALGFWLPRRRRSARG